MADWYYAKNGQQFGPISPAELKKLAKEGALSPHDLVFQIGGTKWVEASSVKGLFPPTGSKPLTPVHTTPTPEPVSVPAPTPTPAPADDFDLPATSSKVSSSPAPTGIRVDRQDDDFDPHDSRSRPAPTKQRSGFMDFMMLRSFISPTVIVVLFWLTVVAALGVMLLGSLMGLLMMAQQPVVGLGIILGSILLSILLVFVDRIVSEIAIVIFRIAEEATKIRKILEKLRQEK